MYFLLHIFKLSWSLHSFPSIRKISFVSPISKMGKPRDSTAFFRLVSLTSCVLKLFERIILSRLLFPMESSSNQIFIYLSPFWMGLKSPSRALGQFSQLTTDFSKDFDLVWHPFLFHKTILAGTPSCFACWAQSVLFYWRDCVVFKNTKVAHIEFVEMFGKDPFLVLYFSIFSSMIFLFLGPLPSAALFMLTTWSFVPRPPRYLVRWSPHKDL